MTKFRPCIDLHNGQVKQIVGGSLDTQELRTNFVSEHSSEYYAQLYKNHNLEGGHVIKLGPGNDDACLRAIKQWPNKLHVGGGINLDNAQYWIDEGAEKIIVTSWLFPDGTFSLERLQQLEQKVGRDRIVVDLSCKRTPEGWTVAMNKWQTLTDMHLSKQVFGLLEQYTSEFLVHAADVEGLCQGIDQELVVKLGEWVTVPCTYAGGASGIQDLDLVKQLSGGKVDLTIGSALDIFGGALSFSKVIEWNQK
ncbi:5-proFAR isomerase [Gorgonomyces haynaldii]|nr:5-proFAR isomerase [Gorgonomyces haynaldii]